MIAAVGAIVSVASPPSQGGERAVFDIGCSAGGRPRGRRGGRHGAATTLRCVAAAAIVVSLVVSVPATAVAQSQRFPDVPADHYAFEAVEWAAEVGVTAGYIDGTFQPQRALIKRHAVIFMERYYDGILEAEESEDFTRGDMMVLLKATTNVASQPAQRSRLDEGARQLCSPPTRCRDRRVSRCP